MVNKRCKIFFLEMETDLKMNIHTQEKLLQIL